MQRDEPSSPTLAEPAWWWALQRKPSQAWAAFLRVLPVAAALYGLWVAKSVAGLLTRPIVHEEHSSIDPAWLQTIMPAMYVPTVVVWAYLNWAGWQFFTHN